ncbi:MAG: hypothetical protein KTR31_03255 [Myxococcales bacterium]|nr:hypothetical protein [Myxococcales bacterium]
MSPDLRGSDPAGPFDPPAGGDEIARERASTMRWGLVMGTWGLCGTAVGTAVGSLLQITQGVAGAAATGGTTGMAAGGALGVGVLLWDRMAASQRPVVAGPSGRDARPLHGAVLGLPLAAALPAVGVLAVVSTVASGSPLAAVGFGMVGVAVVWAAQRVWSHHRLARALEAEGERAERMLRGVAGHPLLSSQVRRTARVNLAMLALRQGRGADALEAFEGVWRGAAACWVAVGRALAHLLVDDPPSRAAAHLRIARSGSGARVVAAEADAVEVLITWRSQGAEAARVLAEERHGPAATALHTALLQQLRTLGGDDWGASALHGDAVAAVRASGLGAAIPELQTTTSGPAARS